MELMRRSHQPVAYSTNLGPVAHELREATVPVIDRLSALGEPPDIIHGQHHYETLTALLRFPNVPAIYYCHGWIPWQESPLRHPNIVRYVAVSYLSRERLIAEGGISPDKIEVLFNFFDRRLFPPRPPLPETPKRALVFSNDFSMQNGLPVLMEACKSCGIELDVRGIGSGNICDRPGDLLPAYDIVFAKGRAAIEALAVGAAVVLCGAGKLGPMVTTENFGRLRSFNFGLRVLSLPFNPDSVIAELRKYNPDDPPRLAETVRSICELQSSADGIIRLYESVIAAGVPSCSSAPSRAGADAAEHLERWAKRYKNSAEVACERDAWVSRCNIAEQTLAQNDKLIHEQQKLIHEQQKGLADRQGWIHRCLAAEQACGNLQIVYAHLSEAKDDLARGIRLLRAQAAEKENLENLLKLRDAESAVLTRELSAMRTSATWRWAQAVLQTWLVQALFGGAIRFVAKCHAINSFPNTVSQQILKFGPAVRLAFGTESLVEPYSRKDLSHNQTEGKIPIAEGSPEDRF